MELYLLIYTWLGIVVMYKVHEGDDEIMDGWEYPAIILVWPLILFTALLITMRNAACKLLKR